MLIFLIFSISGTSQGLAGHWRAVCILARQSNYKYCFRTKIFLNFLNFQDLPGPVLPLAVCILARQSYYKYCFYMEILIFLIFFPGPPRAWLATSGLCAYWLGSLITNIPQTKEARLGGVLTSLVENYL